MKVNLSGVPETLFITLRIRAIETVKPNGAIKDPYAIDILHRIELASSSKDKVSEGSQVGTIARTLVLDEIILDFLSKHPKGATIVNLGCGLDARCKRLPLHNCLWLDIDVEESIGLRKLFFKETDNYKMIARSMFDDSWMNSVPRGLPLLIISEGVMMYFKEEDIRELIYRIGQRFHHAEMAFDVINTWTARNYKWHPDIKKYNAPFRWGTDNVYEMEDWYPGLHVIKEYLYMDRLKKRWPLFFKVMLPLFPSLRKSSRIVHMKFQQQSSK